MIKCNSEMKENYNYSSSFNLNIYGSFLVPLFIVIVLSHVADRSIENKKVAYIIQNFKLKL
jgi:hypothetical protein